MSTISLPLNDWDEEIVRKLAVTHNVSGSELIRNAIIEKIDNEIDVELFGKDVQHSRYTYWKLAVS